MMRNPHMYNIKSQNFIDPFNLIYVIFYNKIINIIILGLFGVC